MRHSSTLSSVLREGVFSETLRAPVLLAQVLPERTPLQRTGYEPYSPSFRELTFSETRLPAYNILGNSVCKKKESELLEEEAKQ